MEHLTFLVLVLAKARLALLSVHLVALVARQLAGPVEHWAFQQVEHLAPVAFAPAPPILQMVSAIDHPLIAHLPSFFLNTIESYPIAAEK